MRSDQEIRERLENLDRLVKAVKEKFKETAPMSEKDLIAIAKGQGAIAGIKWVLEEGEKKDERRD